MEYLKIHLDIGYFMGYTMPVHAPVAQLDRASDYGSEGREFESSAARHSTGKWTNPLVYKGLSTFCCLMINIKHERLDRLIFRVFLSGKAFKF